MVKVGEYLKDNPAYSKPLKANDGSEVILSSFIGQQPVVIFFYPKAATPGCTKEACSFRDGHSNFNGLAKVFGVSSDDTEANNSFATKQSLPFPLLSDTGGELRAALGVKKHYFVIPGRQTFVVDKDGRVLLSFSNLSHKDHVDQALNALKNSS